MAYQVKYKFQFESIHDVFYGVSILEDGFAGTATTRPLGKAPTLRMAEGDPFRATSLDLDLECQVDGEFASLYTSDPLQYKVEVRRGGSPSQQGSLVWSGFVATELYAEPNIAPPYDVHVTATDGLGTLKEYIFEGAGLRSVAAHFRDFLSQTGLSLNIDMVSSLAPASGTPGDFMDNVYINLDHMAGENVYDVLKALLESIHATITQSGGRWLVIRETDFAVGTGGDIAVYRTPASSGSSFEATISARVKSVGKMGVADMWPVGQTTRRVVPAKRRITVEAPWNIANAAYSVQDDEWDLENELASWVNYGGDGNNCYRLTYTGPPTNPTAMGAISMPLAFFRFSKDVAVKIRTSGFNASAFSERVGIVARYASLSGDTSVYYYYSGAVGWTNSVDLSKIEMNEVKATSRKASQADEISFVIPSRGTTVAGVMTLYVYGVMVDVFDVSVTPVINKGYRDEIVIGNGARGDGESVSILGGRMLQDEFDVANFYAGIWTPQSGHPAIYTFSDSHYSSKDYLSLQTLGRALSVALPRIETEGTLDIPSGLIQIPIAIYCNSAYSIIQSFEWNLVEDELRMKALTLPAASLTVTSETITSTGNAGAGSSGGSSGGGGGGGGGSTVTVTPGTTAGGSIATIGVDGTDYTIKNGVAFGASGNGKTILTANGQSRTLLLEGWSELPPTTSSDNGKVLKVANGAWAKGTDSAVGIDDVTSQEDGTVDIELTSGDVVTIDMNHAHPQYLKFYLCEDQAEYDAITVKDATTLYMIPESS